MSLALNSDYIACRTDDMHVAFPRYGWEGDASDYWRAETIYGKQGTRSWSRRYVLSGESDSSSDG